MMLDITGVMLRPDPLKAKLEAALEHVQREAPAAAMQSEAATAKQQRASQQRPQQRPAQQQQRQQQQRQQQKRAVKRQMQHTQQLHAAGKEQGAPVRASAQQPWRISKPKQQ